jgi:hypothetical protein
MAAALLVSGFVAISPFCTVGVLGSSSVGVVTTGGVGVGSGSSLPLPQLYIAEVVINSVSIKYDFFISTVYICLN